MTSLKLFYALFFLFTFNCLNAQSNTVKWRSGFTLSSSINAMFSKPITNNRNVTFIGGTLVNLNNTRTWKFHYKSGFAMGFLQKWSLGEKYALQGEVNLLWNRQEAELSDIPPSINDPQFSFINLIERKGTIRFNTYYLQIPLIVSRLVNNETAIEAGLCLNSAVINQSESQFKVTTFSSFDNTTGRFTVFNPARVENQTKDIASGTRLGWLLGIQHNITDKIAMRLRYEGGISSNFSDFEDLREQRILVGMVVRLNK